jgi:hypothetical protein
VEGIQNEAWKGQPVRCAEDRMLEAALFGGLWMVFVTSCAAGRFARRVWVSSEVRAKRKGQPAHVRRAECENQLSSENWWMRSAQSTRSTAICAKVIGARSLSGA